MDETLDVLSWKVGEISSSKYVNAASQIKATTGLSVQGTHRRSPYCERTKKGKKGVFKRNATHRIVSHRNATFAERVESMLNALQFIFRGAIADKLDGAEALQAVLRKHADLSDAARKVISETWGKRSANGTLNSSSSSSASSSSSSSTLQTGQLLRLDWKLGVGIRSSKCKALKAPFVAMNFNVGTYVRTLTRTHVPRRVAFSPRKGGARGIWCGHGGERRGIPHETALFVVHLRLRGRIGARLSEERHLPSTCVCVCAIAFFLSSVHLNPLFPRLSMVPPVSSIFAPPPLSCVLFLRCAALRGAARTADPTGGSSGKIASHLMELSLSDLAQLKQAFQEIAAQLESI